MREHCIRFKFIGSAADGGRLDASDSDHYHEGARQLLATHAYFFTHGRAPKGGALNHTRHYRVWRGTSSKGSFVESWYVALLLAAGGMVLGEYMIRALDYGYEHFLKDSLGPIIRRQPSSMPLELCREPYFAPQDTGNRPVFDEDAERTDEWGQLRERSTLIMPKVARPIGRSATKLIICGEQGEIGTIDMDLLRKLMADVQAYKEAAITSAVHEIRARQRRWSS
jgi:hypothetical protein